MQAQPAQLIADTALAELIGIESQQRREMATQVASGEAGRLKAEDDQRREECLGPLIGEAQCRGALAVDLTGLGKAGEGRLTEGRIVADSLDVEQTSIGLSADLPQGGQVDQPLADPVSRGRR